VWWGNNQQRFPRLPPLPWRFVRIELLELVCFPQGQHLLQGRRSLLAPKNVDMMIFLHDNCEQLE
jgi:hypothetical protein